MSVLMLLPEVNEPAVTLTVPVLPTCKPVEPVADTALLAVKVPALIITDPLLALNAIAPNVPVVPTALILAPKSVPTLPVPVAVRVIPPAVTVPIADKLVALLAVAISNILELPALESPMLTILVVVLLAIM